MLEVVIAMLSDDWWLMVMAPGAMVAMIVGHGHVLGHYIWKVACVGTVMLV